MDTKSYVARAVLWGHRRAEMSSRIPLTKRRMTFAAVLLQAALLLTLLAPAGVAHADPHAQACQHNPDNTCAVSAARGAYLFSHGHYKRADGISQVKVFASPSTARSVIMGKLIAYYKRQSPAKQLELRNRYGVKPPPGRVGGLGGDDGSCVSWDFAKCVAGRMWTSLTTNVSCGSSDPYRNANPGSCTTWDDVRNPGLTKEQVQNGGLVGFCAGNVFLSVRGKTGQSALLMLGFGASQCMWAAWAAHG